MICPKCGSTDTEPDKMFTGITKCKSCGIVMDDKYFNSSPRIEGGEYYKNN